MGLPEDCRGFGIDAAVDAQIKQKETIAKIVGISFAQERYFRATPWVVLTIGNLGVKVEPCVALPVRWSSACRPFLH